MPTTTPTRIFALALAFIPALVLAQTTDLPNAQDGWRGGEIYASSNQLNNGYSNWREAGLRGIYQREANAVAGEIIQMNRFNEDGTYLGVGDTLVLNPDWYAFLGLGAGDGAAYLPRYRLDAFIHRKLLPAKNLIVSLGAGTYHAPDGHQDNNANIGMTLYTTTPWVFQAEARRTSSNPGSIQTQQYFVAATWGHAKQTRFVGRHGWGHEGYQSLGNNVSISRFASNQTSLTVQHWIGADWGVKFSGERYHNPYYQRHGLTVALFKDWP